MSSPENSNRVQGETGASEIQFRPFSSSSELQLQRDLFRDAFPETVGTSQERDEHYFWKFHSFPDVRPSYEYGAYLNGRMVGYYAAIPYPYKIKGVSLRSAMVCDVMTHSSMRGKGVFTKLGAYALKQMENEGLDIAFGYPIRPEVIPGHLKVGWKISGELPIYLRVGAVTSALKNHKARFLTPILNLGCSLFCSVFSPPRSSEGLKVSVLSPSDYSASAAASELLSSSTALQKNADFVKWRYSAPDIDYRVICAWQHDRIVAAAVFRATELKGIPTLAILDISHVPGCESAVGAIMREADSLRKETGSELIAGMLSTPKAKFLGLGRMGYTRSPFVFKLITRHLSEKSRSLGDVTVNDFHPMWVDSDDL